MKKAEMKRRNLAAVTDAEGKGAGAIKEYGIFCAGILLVLLILSRYIVNGEPVDIRSEMAGAGDGIAMETIELSDGMELIQPLTIPESANWRQGYYALLFARCSSDSGGTIVFSLEQEGGQDVRRIAVKELEAGMWTRLDGLEIGKLKSGAAVLSIHTEGVADGELEVVVCQDHNGFGNLWQNGKEQQVTLAQAYHYHITGMEYTVRLACYGIVLLCAAGLLFLVLKCGEKGDAAVYPGIAFGVLTVMFPAIIYLIDSSIYLEPTYAEAVTNFLHYAREEKLAANLLITDAGYLPLLPRLVTLFYLKVLRLPSTYALYFMQGTACLLCSMIWAFFVLPPFDGIMRLSNRILWCLMVMMTCFCEETFFFTNHAYWGIYLLLLLLVADLERFPGWIYGGLLCGGVLFCLSKGTYAVMLPLMFFYLLFFRKSIGRRDRWLAYVTGGAALLQLLYSFSGQGDGGGWIDTAAMGQIGYWFRLAARVFVEFGASLVTPFGETLQGLPWLVVGTAAAVGVGLIAGFVGNVFSPGLRGESVDRRKVTFYTMALFQLIVSAFFLVTVKRVPDTWGEMGRIIYAPMGDKYEIFSNMGCYMLWLTGGSLLARRMASDWNTASMPADCHKEALPGQNLLWQSGMRTEWIGKCCGRYGILALLVVLCLTNPMMRLSGWADAEVSDGRVYAGNINASWRDCKDMISESAFFIPVRGDNWAYSRNCNLYQVGTDLYFEETSGVNLEEAYSGYHSAYEIRDASQAQNLIEVMIERPMRVDGVSYRVRLLDAEENILAEAEQTDSGRNKKCIFRFEEPVSGVKTIQLIDADGNPAYYKDYIAWVAAW